MDFSAFGCVMFVVIFTFVGVILWRAVVNSKGDGGPRWGE